MAAIDRMLCQAAEHFLYIGTEEIFYVCELQKTLDKTTPRLIQFHTLKNAANPPFLGGFSIFGTVAA